MELRRKSDEKKIINLTHNFGEKNTPKDFFVL